MQMKFEFCQDGMQIVSCDPETLDWVVCGFSESSFGLDEDMKHGYLLKAAPDLLAALKEIADLAGDIRLMDGSYLSDRAFAAIAKVEGRQETRR
jgi:hypothetical protein